MMECICVYFGMILTPNMLPTILDTAMYTSWFNLCQFTQIPFCKMPVPLKMGYRWARVIAITRSLNPLLAGLLATKLIGPSARQLAIITLSISLSLILLFLSSIPKSVVNIYGLTFDLFHFIIHNLFFPFSQYRAGNSGSKPMSKPQSLITTSTHSNLHSLLPNKLLNHSTPIPVHSLLANEFFASSSAVFANAIAVLLNAPA